jgi:DNA sulfur modification protein DndE
MFNRIYVSVETDQRLRMLKARTGLAPNILCRIGFCLSINELGVPDPGLFGTTQAREFNRYTLTGPWDELFFALLRERLADDGISASLMEDQFRAHISRGVLLLTQRMKTIGDLASMVQQANAQFATGPSHDE